MTPIAKRVRARFALTAYTGIIAIRAGILPWSEQQVMDAAKSAYSAWHERINIVSDIDRGVESVRDFILKHEAQFEIDAERPPRDRAGWVRDDMHHFTTAAFKDACNGADPTKVKRALDNAGLLHKTKGLRSNIRVSGKTVTVISIKSGILSELSKTEGSTGSRGSKRDTARDLAATTCDAEGVAGVAEENTATAATVCDAAPVAPQTCMDKGPLPPLPPLPQENDNLDFSDEPMSEEEF